MSPHGWKHRKYGYIVEGTVNYEELVKKAKELLSKAVKGQTWACRWGSTHIPLLVNNQIVGKLWEDLDLNSLEIGAYWFARVGTKVELVHNKKVVGVLWIS